MASGMSPYQYVTLSRVKYESALYHAHQFKHLLEDFFGSFLLTRSHGIRTDAPMFSHSDGSLIQLFAAFDSFACAVGHHYGLANPDKVSFRTLKNHGFLRQASPEISRGIAAIVDSDEFIKLNELRNATAHRTVLTMHLVFDTAGHTRAFLARTDAPYDQGEEALPILLDLLRWARGPLLWLWNTGEAWLAGGTSAKGTVQDIESQDFLQRQTEWLTTERPA